MLLVALAVAASAPHVPSLGSFLFGQTLFEADAIAARAGDRLVPEQPQGRYQEYALVDGRQRVLGTVGFCDGRLQHANLRVPTYNEFTALLRQRISELGQPHVSFVPIPMVDGSRRFEELTFTWPAHLYTIDFNANSEDGAWGDQAIGGHLRCQ